MTPGSAKPERAARKRAPELESKRRVLRPRQDGDREGVDGGVRQAAVPGRSGVAVAAAAGPLRAARLPVPRCGRGAHGHDARVGPAGDQGVGPGPRGVDRAGDPRRGDRADRVRRGARSHPRAPEAGPAGVHRVGVTRGDRRAAGPPPRRPRGHRERGPRSTTRAATPAGSTSTPTAPTRPRPCGRSPRPGASTSTASYAYSDSATDIPMLEAVGHPVAVNPDRELARVAAEREWEVRWFIHRVRLRDRVRMPAPGPTAAVGGGLAATAAAGTAAWWWLRRSAASTPTGAGPRVAQTARTFLAATAASATRTRRMSSFFMSSTLPRAGRAALRLPPATRRPRRATGSPWASRRRAARRGS